MTHVEEPLLVGNAPRASARSSRAAVITSYVIGQLCLVGSLIAQDAPRSSIHDNPSRGACSWSFVEPSAITQIIEDSSLWFGRIGGFTVGPRSKVLLVSDVLRQQVLRINLTSKTFAAIGRAGEGPGEFRVPTAVAAASDGSFWAYDAVLQRLSHFERDGTYAEGFPLPFALIGVVSLAVDRRGDVYVAGSAIGSEFAQYLVHKFSRAGVHMFSFADRKSPRVTADPGNRGGYLAVGATGATLWLSLAGPILEVDEYALDGTALRSIAVHSPADLDTPSETVESRGGQMRVVGRRRLGTISLSPLPGRALLNAAVIGMDGMMQFDVIEEDGGRVRASWQHSGPLVAGGDGRESVFSVDPADEPQVVQWRVRRTNCN